MTNCCKLVFVREFHCIMHYFTKVHWGVTSITYLDVLKLDGMIGSNELLHHPQFHHCINNECFQLSPDLTEIMSFLF